MWARAAALALLLAAAAGAAVDDEESSGPQVPPPEPSFDALWLRYPQVSGGAAGQLAGYRSLLGISAAVICAVDAPCKDSTSRSQLAAVAAELQTGLRGLLGTAFNATVNTKAQPLPAGTRLVARVLGGAAASALGKEGFRIRQDLNTKTVHIEAAISSGLLYGAFKLLSLIQQNKAIPQKYDSTPAMEFRVWNLWDNVDGSIEQGFSGRSILWPYALLDENRPPPRTKLFLRKCNASDSWQQWAVVADSAGNRSTIVNVASDECLSSKAPRNPMQTTVNTSACTKFSFNTNRTISDPSLGRCMDVQFGEGPVIQLTSCKYPPTSHDPVELAYVRKQVSQAFPLHMHTHMPRCKIHMQSMNI